MFMSPEIENSYCFFFFIKRFAHAVNVVKFDVIPVFLSLISGKTYTLMAPDGITAGVIERCFKRITQDDRHDYKVQDLHLHFINS